MQSYVQDMPPKGGFPKVNYTRNMPKRGVSGPTMFAICAGAMTFGFIMIGKHNKNQQMVQKEKRLRRINVLATLQAEEDRRFLKVLWHNEQAEAELMADREDWVVGERPYKTRWMKDYYP